jgi:hypothetical protein
VTIQETHLPTDNTIEGDFSTMVTPVSGAVAAYQSNATQSTPAPKPAAPATQKPDTVHLSHAATGDADHDGDSH